MTTSVPPVERSTGTAAVSCAAIGAAGVCLTFAGVQVALAAGAPVGEHVWGGTQIVCHPLACGSSAEALPLCSRQWPPSSSAEPASSATPLVG